MCRRFDPGPAQSNTRRPFTRPMTHDLILAILIFLAAILYSSVGHAGASGYLAAMALMGVAPQIMKPTALALNILVATIGTIRFYSAGHFSWRTFWPFVVGSIPLAFVGGAWQLHARAYKVIVGIILVLSAIRLAIPARKHQQREVKPPDPAIAVGAGGVLGLLAGLTGTGGGIFLSPLLLLMRWGEMPRVAGVTVAFILVNSVSGLIGNVASVRMLPSSLWIWAIAAGGGGLLGAELGSRRLTPPVLRQLLGVVLVVAG